MTTTKWQFRWYHVALAFSLVVVVLLSTIPASRDRTLEYFEQIRAHLGGQSNDPSNASSTQGSELAIDQGDEWYKWNMPYNLPDFDVVTLKSKRPHNYKGPGHPTFATFYATRNASHLDPYFIAIQQIVYRLLWDPHIKSVRYPVTVFVAPFVPQDKRDYFAAGGALVRELPTIPFDPIGELDNRYLDVMSKLLLWNQTEFSLITFLDGDAFPWVNIDHIMDAELTPPQTCKQDLLEEENRELVASSGACEYAFSALTEVWAAHSVNAGVMVLKPNEVVCNMLLALSQDQTKYDNAYPEQGPLTLFYRPDGPFPSSHLSAGWNGGPDRIRDPDKDSYIVHGKVWILVWGDDDFVQEDFNATWLTMLDLYEGKRFVKLRNLDDSAEDER